MAIDADEARQTGSLLGYQARFMDVDGIRTRYYDIGEGNEEVLFLVHGALFDGLVSANTWSRNFAGLSKKYRVVAADKLGCGMTDNPRTIEEYTQHDVVQHLWAVMQKLGITSAHIAGQSNGGYTAARLALEHPTVAKSLILSDTATLGPPVGDIAERRRAMYVERPSEPREGLRYRWEALGYTKGDVTEEYLDAALFMADTPKAKQTEEDLKNGGSEANRRRFSADKEQTLQWLREGRLTMPVLITWGANDPSAILPIGIELFEMIRQKSDRVQLHVFNHVGHFHFREIPDEWNDVVMTFLANSK
jgi:2-hydroxy-6-oxonona-2,4-dienedioate hydrolase